MTLKDKTIKGVKWTTFSSVFTAILQIIQLSILARLLNPSDFGLMAIVMVVIGFSNMFIDMGLSNAIIYKQNVTDNQLTSLYWVNVAIGVILFFIILIISPFIAVFYESPQLKNLIILVGITFLIQPFGQQFMVLLQKELQFDKITKTQIIARLLSFIAIIIMAYYDFGVFSLAYGVIIYSILSTIIFIFYGKEIYKPRFYINILDLNEFLHFGMYQMGEKLIQYFASQFDTILIGKLLGIEILGVYNIAKNLVSRPSTIINPIITKVTFPVMSKIKDNNYKLRDVYLKTINYLTLINVPIYLLIVLFAEPIVFLLIGEVWVDAIPIIQILAIAFFLISIGNPAGSLLLSRGKANIAFYWNLITFILYPIFIVYGSNYGIKGIAISIILLHILFLYPNWRFIVKKTCQAGLKDYVNSILPFIAVGLFCFIIIYLILNLFDAISYFIFGLGVIFYSIFYFGLIYLLKKNIILDILEMLLPKFIKK